MADGVDIDLYADDLEQDFNQEGYNEHDANVDLYDDVIAAPSSDGNADEVSGIGNQSQGNSHPSKRVALYIGNLTWWTTDQDVTDAISAVGVNDVLDIKFFENRANGQSKGFCIVTLGSDSAVRAVMEKLPKKELHGQNPVVTTCSRQHLNHFEMQSRKPSQASSQSREYDEFYRGERRMDRFVGKYDRNSVGFDGKGRGERDPYHLGGGGNDRGPPSARLGPRGPSPQGRSERSRPFPNQGRMPPVGPPLIGQAPPPPQYTPGGPSHNYPPPPMRLGGPPPPQVHPPGPPPPLRPPPPQSGPPPPLPANLQGPPPPTGAVPPRTGPPPPSLLRMPPPRGPPPPLGAPRGPPLIPDHRGPPPVTNDWERQQGGMHSLPPVSQPPPHPGGVPPGPAPPGMPPNRLPPPVPPVVPAPNVPPPAPHVNPAFFPQHAGLPPPPTTSQPSDPYGRPPPTQYTHDYRGPTNDSHPYSVDPRSMLPASSSMPSRHTREQHDRRDMKKQVFSANKQDPLNPPINESEFEEIMSRNRTVSSSAIARAVADASTGEFASAIETLVTAISLIKQSKVANDDRCKILISSLQDTLHGIESKSYSTRSKDRPRSRERDRSRERSSRREKSSRRDRSRSRERDYRDRSRERDRYHEDRYRDKEREHRSRH
ncbi:cleavage and polyadenylation specificity factor subunit 6-like isoform X3 [Dermacentor andersoni]|uniref:cleavage and polyadenylation specificity factor subunit 6-like isoform X3 n=1 Tax=Dermacentor andersoni TaxID=34620 RepID=UPI00215545A2|nr:cleavage and polyadenylation specificity factor subunit 6-like isoform X3 [Dermacentor andersoni]